MHHGQENATKNAGPSQPVTSVSLTRKISFLLSLALSLQPLKTKEGPPDKSVAEFLIDRNEPDILITFNKVSVQLAFGLDNMGCEKPL
ncbi:MAG: hypothetical protein NTY86_16485 [Deltaproteobacteria bacterium]|nr:hypothetical protein [Deltaproteobacteria bacterium]